MLEDLEQHEALGPAPALPAFPRAGACEPGMGPTDQSRRIPAPFGICQALPAQLPGNLQLCGDGRLLKAGTWPGGEWHTSFKCRAGACGECSLRQSLKALRSLVQVLRSIFLGGVATVVSGTFFCSIF